MSVHQLHRHVDAILKYMQPHWEFVNCHMVNFLTDNHWKRFVPQALDAELTSVTDINDCIEDVFWQRKSKNTTKFGAWRQFVEYSKKHRLEEFVDVVTKKSDLEKLLHAHAVASEKLVIKEFMCEKKQHEVEITAALVNDLIEYAKARNLLSHLFVVDAGDGKGYLSSRLALQYGHKVLGIDANAMNTENALKRGIKLERAWPSLKNRATFENNGIKVKAKDKKSETSRHVPVIADNYKTTACFINNDLNLAQAIKSYFPEENGTATTPIPIHICLTGLHTCGNLAPTCLKAFHSQADCKILYNIGCCYHLLKERYAEKEFYGNKIKMDSETDAGFPMSQYLKQQRVVLGRNARMLAAQSIERTSVAKELPNISLFYRALLEVIICECKPELKNSIQVGKIRKYQNFETYLQLCIGKLPQIDFLANMKVTEIKKMEEEFKDQYNYLNLFYLLRMSFAPALESLILLDRLLYLKELDYHKSYLTSVFDAVISPRHYAIIAIKN